MAQKDTRDVPDWKKRSDVPPFIPTDDSYELYDGRESIFLKESNKDLVEFITHIDFDPWVFHRGRGMGEFCNIVSLFRQQIEMARPDIRFEWIPCAETPPRTVGKPWVDPHEIRRYDPNGKE